MQPTSHPAIRQPAKQPLNDVGTVFRFDFAPKFIRRDLSLGDAVRELKRLTGNKIKFWRCPVRGLAVQCQTPPTTGYLHDRGETWTSLRFSTNPDETAAKQEVVLDVLLTGIGLFRDLPNAVFDERTAMIRALLTARASTPTDEWLALKAKLDPRIQPLLDTHAADLRQNLLAGTPVSAR